MCVFKAPSIPKPPSAPTAPPPVPTPTPTSEPIAQDPQVAESRQARASITRLATGSRRSTILTSGGGLGLTTSAQSSAKKTLLGQ